MNSSCTPVSSAALSLPEYMLCVHQIAPLPPVCRLRTEFNIILSTDYVHCNVLRLKPPMVFTKENVDYLMANLDSLITRFSVAQGQIEAVME